MKIIIISKNENSKSIGYLLEFFKSFDIYLVSPNAKNSIYERSNLTKVNDNELLDFNKLKAELQIDKFGWYYQQFLKYKSVLKFEGNDFLIIDGDTIIKKELAKENLLCTTNKSTDERYEKLYLKFFKNHTLYGKSFITNQMVFNKQYLMEMLDKIEKNFSKNWILAISDLIKSNKDILFSEYQTYAEYLLNTKNNIKVQNVKVFRRMDLINDSIENALKKYDILAFEHHHKTGILRKLRAKLFYLMGKSLG